MARQNTHLPDKNLLDSSNRQKSKKGSNRKCVLRFKKLGKPWNLKNLRMEAYLCGVVHISRLTVVFKFSCGVLEKNIKELLIIKMLGSNAKSRA